MYNRFGYEQTSTNDEDKSPVLYQDEKQVVVYSSQ